MLGGFLIYKNTQKPAVIKDVTPKSETQTHNGFIIDISGEVNKPGVYEVGNVAIISAGKENQYGHPATLTLKKLKNAGYSIYRTDEDGTITISTKNEKLIIKRENE